MRILVTGATGRVGRNLTADLVRRGHSVRGLVMPDDPGRASIESHRVEVVTGNLDDPEAVGRAVKEVDAIYHLGATMLWGSAEYNPQLFAANVKGAFNVLNAAAVLAPNLQRFVFASSAEVYPDLYAKYLPIDESHPTEPYSFYGLTKLAGEQLCHFFHRAHGIPTVIARFSLIAEDEEILRPDGWSGRFLFLSAMRELMQATGRQEAYESLSRIGGSDDTLLLSRDEAGRPYQFHMCDVRDLVQGLVLMLSELAAVGEAFNLSGPSSFAYDEAVRYLSAKAGLPYVEARLPGPPIRIEFSTAKARALLGYSPEYDVFRIIDSAVEKRGKAS